MRIFGFLVRGNKDMSICSALVAWSFVVSQGADVPLKVGGKDIPLRLVSTPAPTAPADFLAWEGWQFVAGPTKLFEPYSVASNWSEIASRYEAAKATKGSPWRSKIYVISKTESTQKDVNGVLRTDRDWLTEQQLQETLEAIARVKAWIHAETGGKVQLEADVELETDPIRWNTYGSEFAQWYMGPRVNGGTYVAEDKVFRGPFNSVLYVLPGYGEKDPEPTVVNGTPVAGVYRNSIDMPLEAGRLELALRRTLLQQVEERLRMQGFAGLAADGAAQEWTLATSLEAPSTEVLLERLKANSGVSLARMTSEPLTCQWKAPGVEVAIVDDADRGKVLKLTEKPNYRIGGVGLPLAGEPISTVEKTPTLSFFVKSLDRDPISIRVQGSKGAFWISAGRDPILAQPTAAIVASAPFEDDGQWQKISVDLRPLALKAGVTDIMGLAIEPSPNAMIGDMLEFGSGEYFLDDIQLSADAASPLLAAATADLASKDIEARALAAAMATETSPALVAALKDPYPLVRLNAAAAFTKFKDPTAESSLAFAAGDFSAPVQEQALLALAFQGTETAKASLRQTIRFTLGDLAKATAAKLLADTGDAKYTGDILLMFTNPSWQGAIIAVEALAKLPGVNPQARHVFLRSENPALRGSVVRFADPKIMSDRGALEWHALNDPSDAVRSAAYMKLIESGDAAVAAEGYKGIRDDSRYARIQLLNLLAAAPKAQHRPTLIVGLFDTSPWVRAAAIDALAMQEGAVTLEELGTLTQDLHPQVLLALAALSTKKSLKLPAETIAAMKESPDKRVRDAAVTLQG